METTIFFFRFYGSLFMLLGGMSVIGGFMKKTIKRSEDRYFTVSTGYITLLVGLVTIILHNIWSWDSRLVITLLGWSTFIKGIMKTGFPEHVHRKAKLFERGNIIWSIIILLFGAWLFWMSL